MMPISNLIRPEQNIEYIITAARKGGVLGLSLMNIRQINYDKVFRQADIKF